MEKLKTVRKKSGLKAKDIAAALGVSYCTIWHYENGKRRPTFETMANLAKIYGCSVADFVDEVDGSGAQDKGNGTN